MNEVFHLLVSLTGIPLLLSHPFPHGIRIESLHCRGRLSKEGAGK